MGSYVYRRTAEIIPATCLGGDNDPIKLNVYRYFTKPYWNLWDYVFTPNMPRWLEGYDRKYVGKMRRLTAAQDALFSRMQEAGKVSPFVIELSEKDKPEDGNWVYWEPHSYSRMVDDPWADKAKVIGTLRKVGRKWHVELKSVTCPRCNGTQRVTEGEYEIPCPHCEGDGKVNNLTDVLAEVTKPQPRPVLAQ